MAVYRVVPLPDGVSQRYGWQVKRDGQRVSEHYKQNSAIRAARNKAGPDDSVVVHRTDGTVRG